jgi:hypothetical protein
MLIEHETTKELTRKKIIFRSIGNLILKHIQNYFVKDPNHLSIKNENFL